VCFAGDVSKHLIQLSELREGLPYKKTCAWVLRNAKALSNPVPYQDPPGAIIWVKLADPIARILQQG
jgi:hypothetical protein